jgi:hypothetical protein
MPHPVRESGGAPALVDLLCGQQTRGQHPQHQPKLSCRRYNVGGKWQLRQGGREDESEIPCSKQVTHMHATNLSFCQSFLTLLVGNCKSMPAPKDLSKRTKKPKSDAHRHQGPKKRKRVKGQKGSGWGLLGIAVSLTVAFAASAIGMGRRRRAESVSERASLQGMLLRPLQITEHAACRMECR